MAKDSRGNQWVTSQQAVRLYDALREFLDTYDASRASDTVKAKYNAVCVVMAEIEEG